jgi:hypothetical protein
MATATTAPCETACAAEACHSPRHNPRQDSSAGRSWHALLLAGLHLAFLGNILKALPGCGEPSLLAGDLLKATKNLVAIGGIELDEPGLPADLLRSDQGGADPPRRAGCEARRPLMNPKPKDATYMRHLGGARRCAGTHGGERRRDQGRRSVARTSTRWPLRRDRCRWCDRPRGPRYRHGGERRQRQAPRARRALHHEPGLMLWTVQMIAHSALTVAKPRSGNCRKPRACLVCPNTGSGNYLRSRQGSRAGPP